MHGHMSVIGDRLPLTVSREEVKGPYVRLTTDPEESRRVLFVRWTRTGDARLQGVRRV